jgi:Zn-dependent peptidase ImmA (M78 family)
LVLHGVPHELMEDEADEFASELLMQQSEFKISVSQFGIRPSLRSLVALKPYWKVAISAMIMRMGQLGIISDTDKRSFFIQMSNLRMRLAEPQPFPKERPVLYSKIVKEAIGDLPDEGVMAQIMKIPADVFRRLYASSLQAGKQTHSSRLRLV